MPLREKKLTMGQFLELSADAVSELIAETEDKDEAITLLLCSGQIIPALAEKLFKEREEHTHGN